MLGRRRLLHGLASSAAASLPACARVQPPRSERHALLGRPLPDFERRTFSGETIRTGQLRGRAVLIEFFAEWCGPCRTSLPTFERLRREHPAAAFIGISEDEHPADAIWLMKHYALGFPAVHDRDRTLWHRFAMRAMPTTFVADARGTIRWVAGPNQVEAELRYAIALLTR